MYAMMAMENNKKPAIYQDQDSPDGSTTAEIAPSQDSLTQYLAEVERFQLLTPEEEKDLARRYQETGDLEAAQRLVTSNLRFVVKIAMEYRRFLPAVRIETRGGRRELVRLLDLIQEGNIGLMMAVKRFDPDRGYRLISYAVWWIRAYIQKHLLYNFSLVKLGTTQAQRKLFFKLAQAKRKLESLPAPSGESAGGPEPGGEPVGPPEQIDYAALAKMLGVGEKELVETDLRMAARDFSLDARIADEEGSSTYLDALPDGSSNQEETLGDREEMGILRKGLREAWGEFDEREAFVIQNRFLTDPPLTLQEIGKRYRISRERVRQIEEKALAKIRSRLDPAMMIPAETVSRDQGPKDTNPDEEET